MNGLKAYLFFLLFPALLFAEPMYSPTWGFSLDLPEGYEYVEGNNADRYSFEGPGNAKFDIAVYSGPFQNVRQLSDDVARRLNNRGDVDFFKYGDKDAAMMELGFSGFAGWGLCVELGDLGAAPLGAAPSGSGGRPLLVALSYAPPGADEGMDLFHFSALDSLAPSEAERRLPGPVMEFAFPRGQPKEAAVAGTALRVMIREHDAEAAQALVDREFNLLRYYENAPSWQEAWMRFYRAIYRDAWPRVEGALARLGQAWQPPGAAPGISERAFAEKALAWVQGFEYERDLEGSDFVNLVSAVTEGRGDCDCRAMLWAMALMRADIPAAMMVSRGFSHAMGLADVGGMGARFETGGIKWLVAETTAKVGIGQIAQGMSDTAGWIGILFN